MPSISQTFDTAAGLTREQSEAAAGVLLTDEASPGVRFRSSQTTGDLSPADSATISSFHATLAAKPGGTTVRLQLSADGTFFSNAAGDDVENAGAWSGNGVSDFVNVGSLSATIKTVCGYVWLNDNTSRSIIDLNGTARIEANSSGTLAAIGWPNATVYVEGNTNPAYLPTGRWLFFAVTDPTGVVASAVELGRANGAYLDGSLDDVRMYTSVVSQTDLMSLFATHEDSNSSLAHWKFDGDTDDASGNGHDGTNNGGSWLSGFANLPHFGPSIGDRNTIVIQGATGRLQAANHVSIQDVFDGGGTWSAWIYVQNATNVPQIINKSSGSSGQAFFLGSQSGNDCKIRFRTFWSGGDTVWESNDRVIGFYQWVHVAVTYNSDDVGNVPLLYVNGAAVATNTSILNAHSGTRVTDVASILRIGNSVNLAQSLQGRIANAAIWNHVRTAEQIAADFANGWSDTADANMASYWPLDDGLGETLADAVGNNDLTSFGTVWQQVLDRPAASAASVHAIPATSLGLTTSAYWRVLLDAHHDNRTASLDALAVQFTTARLSRHPGMAAGMSQLTGGFHG